MKIIKMLTVLLLLFLSSCTKDIKSVTPIDRNIWGYDFNEHQMSGSFAAMRHATESEKGIYMKIGLELRDGGNTNILGYVDKASGAFTIIDSNITTNCSYTKPSACSSHIPGSYEFINYYNNHLYFVTNVTDIDTGVTTMQLIQMDLDGNNRQAVAKLSENVPNSHQFSILFHQGLIFYAFGNNGVHQIDMSTWENKKVLELSNSSGINLLRADANRLYFNADVYRDGDTRVVDALLVYDFTNGDLTIKQRGLPLYQFKDDIYVYYEESDDSMYMFHSSSNQRIKLKQYTGSVLFAEEYFIIKDLSTEKVHDLYLFDHEGTLLDTFKQEVALAMANFAQLVADEYFYTYLYYEDQTAFVRISYKGGKFGNLEVLELWDGSQFVGSKK